MAIRASREVVIDAPPETILDALADIEAVPSCDVDLVKKREADAEIALA